MPVQTEAKEQKVVVFSLNQKEYALDVQHIVSIEKMQHFTRVPHVPNYIKGVINLRGVIIPIIDLRTRFQVEAAEYNQNTRIIIVSMADKEVGLIVDEANDVMNIDMDTIESQPDVIGTERQIYIAGVVKIQDRLLILLKLEKILNFQED